MKHYGPMDQSQKDFLKFVAEHCSRRIKNVRDSKWLSRDEKFGQVLQLRGFVEQTAWYVKTFDFGRDKRRK